MRYANLPTVEDGLHPETARHIVAVWNGKARHGRLATRGCSCHVRGADVLICDFHQGMEEVLWRQEAKLQALYASLPACGHPEWVDLTTMAGPPCRRCVGCGVEQVGRRGGSSLVEWPS